MDDERLRRITLANSPEGVKLLHQLNGGSNIVLSRLEGPIAKLHKAFWEHGAATAIKQRLDDSDRLVENRATLAALVNVFGPEPYQASIALPGHEPFSMTLPTDREAREHSLTKEAEIRGITTNKLVNALCREGLSRAEEQGIDLEEQWTEQMKLMGVDQQKAAQEFLSALFPDLSEDDLSNPPNKATIQSWIEGEISKATDVREGRAALRTRLLAQLPEEWIKLPLDEGREFSMRVAEEPLLDQLQLVPDRRVGVRGGG